jgi:hypothetical protein
VSEKRVAGGGSRSRSPGDFFVIFSLPRCGSTAIHRALNCHTAIECLCEPVLELTDPPRDSLLGQLDGLRATYSGIKYVWEPSGFPFRPHPTARIDDMRRHAERWLALNETLLRRRDQRIVFLRRRDALSRAVSDLLAQQTNVWGPRWDVDVAADEGASYRSELKMKSLRALDLDLVSWYLACLPPMEQRLRHAAAVNPCLDLDYEDLFGRAASRDALDVYCGILDFLGYSTAEHHFDRSRVAVLLGGSGKLNTAEILRRIPNYREIERRFGPLGH